MSYSETQFEVSQVPEPAEPQAAVKVEGRSQFQLTWRRLRRDKVAVVAMIVIVIVVVLAIAAPAFAALTHHPVDIAYPDTGEDLNGEPGGPGGQRLLARHRRARP